MSENSSNEHRVVAGRLRDARLAIGLTQADTAKALEIGRSSVVAIEAGTRKVTGLELRRLSRLYKRDVAWFLGAESPDDIVPDTALHRATAELSDQDKAQVLRFAQFLAAQPAGAATSEPRRRPRPPGTR